MLQEIQSEIEAVKARNKKVEADKAWETSRFRVFALALLTYAMMILLMGVIGIDRPYLSALVPTAGFLLSTLSLRLIKKFWISKLYKTWVSSSNRLPS